MLWKAGVMGDAQSPCLPRLEGGGGAFCLRRTAGALCGGVHLYERGLALHELRALQ